MMIPGLRHEKNCHGIDPRRTLVNLGNFNVHGQIKLMKLEIRMELFKIWPGLRKVRSHSLHFHHKT